MTDLILRFQCSELTVACSLQINAVSWGSEPHSYSSTYSALLLHSGISQGGFVLIWIKRYDIVCLQWYYQHVLNIRVQCVDSISWL